MALEIGFSDSSEHAGKAAFNIGFRLAIGSRQQNLANLGAGRRGHFLSAHHQGEAPAPGRDEITRAMDGSTAGGAGVFIARDGAEAHFRHALQQKRGREALRREAFPKYADKAGINLGRGNSGILDRSACDARNQAFRSGFGFKLAKGAMRPADDCSFGHDASPV